VAALRQILIRHELTRVRRVLDAGCGDCYVPHQLFVDGGARATDLVGVDVHLTDQQRCLFERVRSPVRAHNSWEALGTNPFDLVLLLDVLEHVEDDRGFLADLVSRVVSGAYVLITVPAFNGLFGPHDTFLGHYRRYRTSQLRVLATEAGLCHVEGGYLFASLLVPRLLSLAASAVLPAPRGVGRWRVGPVVSKVLQWALDADNRILLKLQRAGLSLPGLTAWQLCRRATATNGE